MELFTLRNILILGAAYLIYNLSKRVMEVRNKNITERKDVSIAENVQEAVNDMAVPNERYPKGIRELNDKSLGGQPEFYNEVDHSRGRFLGWERTDEDFADQRKVEHGFFRARISRDVIYFWFIKSHKTELTPCVFRPGIDAISLGPGQEQGVPPEGIVIFKRSLDGTRLATGHGERYRSILLDERHKNSILADMILNMKDKERLMGSSDTSKEFTDEIENKLKRSKRLHDAASHRGTGDNPLGNPYGQEMYGDEDGMGAGTAPGADNMWKFEG